jgi:Lysozyme like domain
MGIVLSDDELYAVVVAAGFPQVENTALGGASVAEAMMAIALRESGGDPDAFNGNTATGDRSYGLFQINLKDPDVYAEVRAAVPEVVDSEQCLLIPAVNAKAAFTLCRGGNVELMNIAWYILRAGTAYQQRYQSFLPRAQAAAARWKVTQTGQQQVGSVT